MMSANGVLLSKIRMRIGARRVIAQLVAAWGLTTGTPQAGAQSWYSPPDPLRQVAWAHAPVIIQEMDNRHDGIPLQPNVYGHLLKVDFDHDLDATNNGARAEQLTPATAPYFDLTPTVYYSITETADAFYVGYWFYHAGDSGYKFCFGVGPCVGGDGHQNDLEGYWVVAVRSELTPYGIADVAMTFAHGANIPTYHYGRTPRQSLHDSGPAYPDQQVFHWTDPASGNISRPVLMIRAGAHGTYPAQDLSLTNDVGCEVLVGTVYFDFQCGISSHDLGSGYSVRVHQPADEYITYWPDPRSWCMSATANCTVAPLPLSQNSGSAPYKLASFVDSPLWLLRRWPTMYRPHRDHPPMFAKVFVDEYGNDSQWPHSNVESGMECFADTPTIVAGYAFQKPCGAQPPWTLAGGTDGGSCEARVNMVPGCWYRFGIDMSGFGQTPFVATTIGTGALLVAPASAARKIWGFSEWQRSDTYSYNPYRKWWSDAYNPPPTPNGGTVTIRGSTFGQPGNTCYWYASTSFDNAEYEWSVNGSPTPETSSQFSMTISSTFTLKLRAWNAAGQGNTHEITVSVATENPTCITETNLNH